MCTDKSPKAFVLSAVIQKLPITWLSVDNFDDRVLCYKPTSINHNIHGCFLCRYRATGWFWWRSGLRAVAMWSSSSFTKTVWDGNTPPSATSENIIRTLAAIHVFYVVHILPQLKYTLNEIDWNYILATMKTVLTLPPGCHTGVSAIHTYMQYNRRACTLR